MKENVEHANSRRTVGPFTRAIAHLVGFGGFSITAVFLMSAYFTNNLSAYGIMHWLLIVLCLPVFGLGLFVSITKRFPF